MTADPGRPDPERHVASNPKQLVLADDDRYRAEERLRGAVENGRLAVDRLGPRLDEVHAARTRAELEAACRGLPEPGPRDTLVVDRPPTSGRFVSGILSGFERKGEWVVPSRLTVWSMWGGGRLDLSEARFAGRHTEIRAVSLWGGTRILVPDDIEVEVRGFGLFGVVDKRVARKLDKPATPRVVIRGFALFGAVVTRNKQPAGSPPKS